MADQQESVAASCSDSSKRPDNRGMNDCCDAAGLQRLGHKRAKFFAVIDLTSGYHQAPLSKKSQSASAFITFMGIFAWLRLPMGVKGQGPTFSSRWQQGPTFRAAFCITLVKCTLMISSYMVVRFSTTFAKFSSDSASTK
eukprot:gene42133-52235_t